MRETCLYLSAELGWTDAQRVTLGRSGDGMLAEAVALAPDGGAVLAVAEAWCALRHPIRGRAAAPPSVALAALRLRFGSGAEAAILRALGRQLASGASREPEVFARQA